MVLYGIHSIEHDCMSERTMPLQTQPSHSHRLDSNSKPNSSSHPTHSDEQTINHSHTQINDNNDDILTNKNMLAMNMCHERQSPEYLQTRPVRRRVNLRRTNPTPLLITLTHILLLLLSSTITSLLLVSCQLKISSWPDIGTTSGIPIDFKIRFPSRPPVGMTMTPNVNTGATVSCGEWSALIASDFPIEITCTYTPAEPITESSDILTLTFTGGNANHPTQTFLISLIKQGEGAYATTPLFGGGNREGSTSAFPGYRNGEAMDSLFNQMGNPAMSPDGQFMFIPDSGNHVIRRWNMATNLMTTLWGPSPSVTRSDVPMVGATNSPGYGAGTITTQPINTPDLNSPHSVVLSSKGDKLYVSDSRTCSIRVITLSTISTASSIRQISGGTTCGSTTFISGDATVNFLPYPGALLLDETRIDVDGGPSLYILLNDLHVLKTGFPPILVRMVLVDSKDFLVEPITATTPRNGLAHHDSGIGSELAFLGGRTSMAMANDASMIYILSTAMSPAAPSQFATDRPPSILRHYRIDDQVMATALSWYYSPAEGIFGQIVDGFPDNLIPSQLALIGYPTAIALSPDNKMLYFLDQGMSGTYNIDLRWAISCPRPGHGGVDCDTSLRSLNLVTGEVRTLVGGRATSADGPAESAGIWSGTARDDATMAGESRIVNSPGNSLFMHPSGESIYLFEGTRHSRIREISLTDFSIRTLAGGGTSNTATMVRNIYGQTDGLGPESLFATPKHLITEPSGQYLYVSDAFALTKIDLLTSTSRRVYHVNGTDVRASYAAATDPIAITSPSPLIHSLSPIIPDPDDPHIVWGFQQISGEANPTVRTKFMRVDTRNSGHGVFEEGTFSTGSHQDESWNRISDSYMRVLSGAIQPRTRDIWLSESGFDQNEYVARTRLLRIPSIDNFQPMYDGEVMATGVDTSSDGFGTLTSIVFNSDGTKLYGLDIQVGQIVVFTDFVAPMTPISLAGSGGPGVPYDGTSASATFSFTYNPDFAQENRGSSSTTFSLFRDQNFNSWEGWTENQGRTRGLFTMAIDPTDTRLYITDISPLGVSIIRRLDLITGAVTTIAGRGHTGSRYVTQLVTTLFTNTPLPIQAWNGVGGEVGFTNVLAIAHHPTSGQLFVADSFLHTIRGISTADAPAPIPEAISPQVALQIPASSSVSLTMTGINLFHSQSSERELHLYLNGTMVDNLSNSILTASSSNDVLTFSFSGSYMIGVGYQFRIRYGTKWSIVSPFVFRLLDPIVTPKLWPVIDRLTISSTYITFYGRNLLSQLQLQHDSDPAFSSPTAKSGTFVSSTKITTLRSPLSFPRYFRFTSGGAIINAPHVIDTSYPKPIIIGYSPRASWSNPASILRITMTGTNFDGRGDAIQSIILDPSTGDLHQCTGIRIYPATDMIPERLTCVTASNLPAGIYSFTLTMTGGSTVFYDASFQVFVGTDIPWVSPETVYMYCQDQLLASADYRMQLAARTDRVILAQPDSSGPMSARLDGKSTFFHTSDPIDSPALFGFPRSNHSSHSQSVMPTSFGGLSSGFTFSILVGSTLGEGSVALFSCRSITDPNEYFILFAENDAVHAAFGRGALGSRVAKNWTTLNQGRSQSPQRITLTVSRRGVTAMYGGVAASGITQFHWQQLDFGIDAPDFLIWLTPRTCAIGRDVTGHGYGIPLSAATDTVGDASFWARPFSSQEVTALNTNYDPPAETSLEGCAGVRATPISDTRGNFTAYITVTNSAWADVRGPHETTHIGYYPDKQYSTSPCLRSRAITALCWSCELNTRDLPKMTSIRFILNISNRIIQLGPGSAINVSIDVNATSMVQSDSLVLWDFSSPPATVSGVPPPAWQSAVTGIGGIITFGPRHTSALSLTEAAHNLNARSNRTTLPEYLYNRDRHSGFTFFMWLQLLSALPNQVLFEVWDSPSGSGDTMCGFTIRTVLQYDFSSWGTPLANGQISGGNSPASATPNLRDRTSQKVALVIQVWNKGVAHSQIYTPSLNLGQWISLSYSMLYNGNIRLMINGVDVQLVGTAYLSGLPAFAPNPPSIRIATAIVGGVSSVTMPTAANVKKRVNFYGRIATIAFWDRYLTPDAISSITDESGIASSFLPPAFPPATSPMLMTVPTVQLVTSSWLNTDAAFIRRYGILQQSWSYTPSSIITPYSSAATPGVLFNPSAAVSSDWLSLKAYPIRRILATQPTLPISLTARMEIIGAAVADNPLPTPIVTCTWIVSPAQFRSNRNPASIFTHTQSDGGNGISVRPTTWLTFQSGSKILTGVSEAIPAQGDIAAYGFLQSGRWLQFQANDTDPNNPDTYYSITNHTADIHPFSRQTTFDFDHTGTVDGAFSFSIWFRVHGSDQATTDFNYPTCLVDIDSEDGRNSIFLGLSTSLVNGATYNIHFSVYADGALTSNIAVPRFIIADQWHDATGACSYHTGCNLYLDGNLIGSSIMSNFSAVNRGSTRIGNCGPLHLGGPNVTHRGHGFLGLVAAFGWWRNHAVDQLDAMLIHMAPPANLPPTPDSPLDTHDPLMQLHSSAVTYYALNTPSGSAGYSSGGLCFGGMACAIFNGSHQIRLDDSNVGSSWSTGSTRFPFVAYTAGANGGSSNQNVLPAFAGEWSSTLYVKLHSSGLSRTNIIYSFDPSSIPLRLIYQSDGTFRITTSGCVSESSSSLSMIRANEWYSLVTTFVRLEELGYSYALFLYVNGQSYNSSAECIFFQPLVPSNATIGMEGNYVNYGLDGGVAHLAVYNRVLTNAEIAMHAATVTTNQRINSVTPDLFTPFRRVNVTIVAASRLSCNAASVKSITFGPTAAGDVAPCLSFQFINETQFLCELDSGLLPSQGLAYFTLTFRILSNVSQCAVDQANVYGGSIGGGGLGSNSTELEYQVSSYPHGVKALPNVIDLQLGVLAHNDSLELSMVPSSFRSGTYSTPNGVIPPFNHLTISYTYVVPYGVSYIGVNVTFWKPGYFIITSDNVDTNVSSNSIFRLRLTPPTTAPVTQYIFIYSNSDGATYIIPITRQTSDISGLLFEYFDSIFNVTMTPVKSTAFTRGRLEYTTSLSWRVDSFRMRLTYVNSLLGVDYIRSSGISPVFTPLPTVNVPTWSDRLTLDKPNSTVTISINSPYDPNITYTIVRAPQEVMEFKFTLMDGVSPDLLVNLTSLFDGYRRTLAFAVPFIVDRVRAAFIYLTPNSTGVFIDSQRVDAPSQPIQLWQQRNIEVTIPTPKGSQPGNTDIRVFSTIDGWFNATIKRRPISVSNLTLSYFTGSCSSPVPATDFQLSTITSSPPAFSSDTPDYNLTIPAAITCFQLRFSSWSPQSIIGIFSRESNSDLELTPHTTDVEGISTTQIGSIKRNMHLIINSTLDGLIVFRFTQFRSILNLTLTEVKDPGLAGETDIIDYRPLTIQPAFNDYPRDGIYNVTTQLAFYMSRLQLRVTQSSTLNDSISASNGTHSITLTIGATWHADSLWDLQTGLNNFTIISAIDGTYSFYVYRRLNELLHDGVIIWSDRPFTTPLQNLLRSMLGLQTYTYPTYTNFFDPYSYAPVSFTFPYFVTQLYLLFSMRSSTDADATPFMTRIRINEGQAINITQPTQANGPFALPTNRGNDTMRVWNDNDGVYTIHIHRLQPDLTNISWFDPRHRAYLTPANSVALALDSLTRRSGYFTPGGSNNSFVIRVPYGIPALQVEVAANTIEGTVVLCDGYADCVFTMALVTAINNGLVHANLSDGRMSSAVSLSAAASSAAPPGETILTVLSWLDGSYNYIIQRVGPDVLNLTIEGTDFKGDAWPIDIVAGFAPVAFTAGNSVWEYGYQLPPYVTRVRFSVNIRSSADPTTISLIGSTQPTSTLTSNQGDTHLESAFSPWYSLEVGSNMFQLFNSLDGVYNLTLNRSEPTIRGPLLFDVLTAPGGNSNGTIIEAIEPNQIYSGTQWQPMIQPNGGYNLTLLYRYAALRFRLDIGSGPPSASLLISAGAGWLESGVGGPTQWPLVIGQTAAFIYPPRGYTTTVWLNSTDEGVAYQFNIATRNASISDIQFASSSEFMLLYPFNSTQITFPSVHPWRQTHLSWNSSSYVRIVFVPHVASYLHIRSSHSSMRVTADGGVILVEEPTDTRNNITIIQNMELKNDTNQVRLYNENDGLYRVTVIRKSPDIANIRMRIHPDYHNSSSDDYNSVNATVVPDLFIPGVTRNLTYTVSVRSTRRDSSTGAPVIPPVYLRIELNFSTPNSTTIQFNNTNTITIDETQTTPFDDRLSIPIDPFGSPSLLLDLYDSYRSHPAFGWSQLDGFGPLYPTNVSNNSHPYQLLVSSTQDGIYSIMVHVLLEESILNPDSSTGTTQSSTGAEYTNTSTGTGESTIGFNQSSTGSVDSSTGLPDSSTGLPDSSTGALLDSSTGLPDSSTGLFNFSTGSDSSSSGSPDSSSGSSGSLSSSSGAGGAISSTGGGASSAATLQVRSNITTIYTGQRNVSITIVASRHTIAPLGLNLTIYTNRTVIIPSTATLHFGRAQTMAESTIFGVVNATFTIRALNISQPTQLAFNVSLPSNLADLTDNSDLLEFRPPNPLTITVLPYPTRHFGLPPTPCTCNSNSNSSVCAVGPYGSGACTCLSGFTGSTCASCQAGFAGPNCRPCATCRNGGTCGGGIQPTDTLDGACTCTANIGGLTCDRCLLSTSFGPTCSGVCPACASGSSRCDAGLNGTGVCLCNSGWGGTLCDAPISGALVAFSGSFYGVDTSNGIPIEFNSSASTFTTRIITLPAKGSLFQTTDGKLPAGSALLSVPAVVTHTGGKVIYLPPAITTGATIDIAALTTQSGQPTPFTTFEFQVSTSSTRVSGSATSFIYIGHNNLSPRLVLTAIPANTVYTKPTTGLADDEPEIVCSQGGYVNIGSALQATSANPTVRISITDVDAAEGEMILTIQAEYGQIGFDTALIASSGLDATLQSRVRALLANLSSTAVSSSLSSRSHVLRASMPLLNGVLAVAVYTPRDGLFYGLDTISLSIDDGGNSAVSRQGLLVGASKLASALSDSRYLRVRTQQVNQQITIANVSSLFQVVLPSGVVAGVAAFNGSIPPLLLEGDPTISVSLALADPDAYSGMVKVRIHMQSTQTGAPQTTSSTGIPSFASLRLPLLPTAGPTSLAYQQLIISFSVGSGYGGLTFTTGTAKKTYPLDTVLELSGPIESLNRILADVRYTPGGASFGTEVMTVDVSDQGNTCGAVIGQTCTPTTAQQNISFTIPHREYAPTPIATNVAAKEGSIKTAIALKAEDPNVRQSSTASVFVSSLTYFITSVELAFVAGRSDSLVSLQNFGQVATFFLSQTNQMNQPTRTMKQLFSDYAAASMRSFAPLNVSTGDLFLRLEPFSYGSALARLNFTVVKRITHMPTGRVSWIRATQNATLTIDVEHVNHAPYISNGVDSSLSSSLQPIQFARDFAIGQDSLIELVGADFDRTDTGQLKFWISSLPSKGRLYQLNDTLYAAVTANQLPANTSVRGDPIESVGVEVASKAHRVIYVPPDNDPDLQSLHEQASSNPIAFSGYVFPVYSAFRWFVSDPSGLPSATDGQCNLQLVLPVIPTVTAQTNLTSIQDQDVLITFQPVSEQLYSLNLSAVTIHTRPHRGALFTIQNTNTTTVSARTATKLEEIKQVPFNIYSYDRINGDTSMHLIYVPVDNSYGSPYASFLYSLVSSKGLRSTGMGEYSIDLLKVNHAPVAPPLTYRSVTSGIEPTPIGQTDPNIITLAGTDSDEGDVLQSTIKSMPRNGTLYQVASDGSMGTAILSAGTVVSDLDFRLKYIPHSSSMSSGVPFFDSFLYSVSDGVSSSSAAQVSLLVGSDSLPPIGVNTSVTVAELDSVGVAVTLDGIDPKGLTGNMGAIITRLPLKGTIVQLDGALLGVGLPVSALGASAASSSGVGRRLTYVPPRERGYGRDFDRFGFMVRDANGLLASEESFATIHVDHTYQPAAIRGETNNGRVTVEQDSTNNRIMLNMTMYDSPTLGVVIVSLPNKGGSLYACASSGVGGPGQLINSSMLPFVALAGACTNTPTTGLEDRSGAVHLFYTPTSRAYSDTTLNDGVLESFFWAPYDSSTINQIFLDPALTGDSTSLTRAAVLLLVSASPPIGRVDLQVDFVSYPPTAYPASYVSAGLNLRVLITLAGQDTRNSLPTRAIIYTLPPVGVLWQVDDLTLQPIEPIHATSIGVKSELGYVIYQSPFNYFGTVEFDFFVFVFSSASDAAAAIAEGGVFSPLNPRASPIARVNVTMPHTALPSLVSNTPITIELEQNSRSLVQIPLLSFGGVATGAIVLTSLPTVGDVYQVRDTAAFNYSSFIAQQRQIAFDRQRTAAGQQVGVSPRRRLFAIDTLLSSQQTTTAPDGSVIAFADINLAIYPQPASWNYNPSAGSILPPAAYSTSADARVSGATVLVTDEFPLSSSDLIRAESLPVALSHPASLLLYVPQTRQLGSDVLSYTFQPSTATSTSQVAGSIAVSVEKIFLPPTATSFAVADVDENLPRIMILLAANGNDASTTGITVSIESTPTQGGVLCQLTPTDTYSELTQSINRPCGSEYGSRISRGGQIMDDALRVVYLPPVNRFGAALEEFIYRVEARNLDRLYSASATVTLSVTHINQPPVASNLTVVLLPADLLSRSVSGLGVTPYGEPGFASSTSNPQSISTLYPNSNWTVPTNTPINIPIDAVDPDPEDTPDTLRYFIWRVRGSKGILRARINGTDGSLVNHIIHDFTIAGSDVTLASYSSIRSVILPAPFEFGFPGSRPTIAGVESAQSAFQPPFLTLDPNNMGGPVGSDVKGEEAGFMFVDYFIMDRQGLKSQNATISFRIDCGSRRTASTLAVSNGNNSGVVILSESAGSVVNVWSSVGTMCASCPTGATCSSEGIFFPISLDGYWRSDLFDMRGLAAADTGGSDASLIYLSCTPSTACLSTPFFLNTSEVDTLPCAAGFTSRMCAGCKESYYYKDGKCNLCSDTKDSVLSVVIIGIPVVILAIGFFVLLAKLKLDFIWIGVTIDTFMLIGTLKHFSLNWPVESESMFSAFGVLLINLDVLQLECNIPSVQYRQKWYLMMAIPIAIIGIVIALGYTIAIVWTSVAKVMEPGRVKKAHAKAEEERHASLAAKEDDAAKGIIAVLPKSAPLLLAERSFCTLLVVSLRSAHQLMLRVSILMLKTLYLTISLKAQEPLKCTTMADGSSSLDAQPALSCTDAWYDDMYPIALAASIVYGIGIPLLFTYILFVARPLSPRVHPWLFGIFHCPIRFSARWRAEAARDQITLKKRDSIAAGQKELDTMAAVARWTVTFDSLTDDFNADSFYWAVIRCLRSASLSVIAIWMGQIPLYQATTALMVLWFSLLLQLRIKPFKQRSRVNHLEAVGLMSMIGILFCGLLMYSRQNSDYTGSTWIPNALDGFVLIFTACVGLAVLSLLDRHMERNGFWLALRRKCGCSDKPAADADADVDDGALCAVADADPHVRDIHGFHRLDVARYGRWFNPPAPATKEERRKSIIGWIGQAVPGLKDKETQPSSAASAIELTPLHSTAGHTRRVSLVGPNQLPHAMRNFIDLTQIDTATPESQSVSRSRPFVSSPTIAQLPGFDPVDRVSWPGVGVPRSDAIHPFDNRVYRHNKESIAARLSTQAQEIAALLRANENEGNYEHHNAQRDQSTIDDNRPNPNRQARGARPIMPQTNQPIEFSRSSPYMSPYMSPGASPSGTSRPSPSHTHYDPTHARNRRMPAISSSSTPIAARTAAAPIDTHQVTVFVGINQPDQPYQSHHATGGADREEGTDAPEFTHRSAANSVCASAGDADGEVATGDSAQHVFEFADSIDSDEEHPSDTRTANSHDATSERDYYLRRTEEDPANQCVTQ